MAGRLEKEEVTRRDFLGLAGLWSAFLAILISTIGMLRLPRPRVSPEASSIFRVGKPTDFPPGTIKDIPDRKVRIVATNEGIGALSLVCTHLGCIIRDTGEGFTCPCHGSKFDGIGNVIGGPAPRSLRWLAVSQAPDGTILVDNARETKQAEFYRV